MAQKSKKATADELTERDNEIVEMGKIPPTRSPLYRTQYADTLRIGMSVFDIRCTLGLIVEAEDGKLNREEQITIVMSPQHAKATALILANNLAQWEQTYGVIPTSPLEKPKESKPAKSRK